MVESKAYIIVDELKEVIEKGLNERLYRFDLNLEQIRQEAEQAQNEGVLRLLAFVQSIQSWLIQPLQSGEN